VNATSNPSDESRDLIQNLHDQMRADIPQFKIMGKSLVPPPWSDERVDGMAVRVDTAIDARVAPLEARIAELEEIVWALVASGQVRRAAA